MSVSCYPYFCPKVRKPLAALRRSLALCLCMALLLSLVACESLPDRPYGTYKTDDQALSIAVTEALRANAQTSVLRLTVTNPDEGRIRLAGTVGSDALRSTAEMIASNVEGVRFVLNTIYLH